MCHTEVTLEKDRRRYTHRHRHFRAAALEGGKLRLGVSGVRVEAGHDIYQTYTPGYMLIAGGPTTVLLAVALCICHMLPAIECQAVLQHKLTSDNSSSPRATVVRHGTPSGPCPLFGLPTPEALTHARSPAISRSLSSSGCGCGCGCAGEKAGGAGAMPADCCIASGPRGLLGG